MNTGAIKLSHGHLLKQGEEKRALFTFKYPHLCCYYDSALDIVPFGLLQMGNHQGILKRIFYLICGGKTKQSTPVD